MASAMPSPTETKGPAIGIPAERLAVAVYAVGASVMLPVSLSPYFFQCIVYQYRYRKVCNKINDMEQEYIVPFVEFCLIVIVHYLFASIIMLIIKVYKNQYHNPDQQHYMSGRIAIGYK